MFRVSIALSQLRSNDKDDKDECSLCPRILPNLSVSLPLFYFACLPLPTVSALRARIMTAPLLPTGWVDATWSEGELALCCFENHSDMSIPAIKFTILVKEDFTWTVFFGAQRIETEPNHLLRDIPSILKSPNDVACLTIVASKVCIGNPDARFAPPKWYVK